MGLNLVLVLLGGLGNPWIQVLTPGLTGGLIAGFIANRGLPGGLAAGGLMVLLMFFWMIAIDTGVGVPPMYESAGEFPEVGNVILNIAPTAASVLAGGSIGGLLRELLPRWRREMEKSRSAVAKSNYYKK